MHGLLLAICRCKFRLQKAFIASIESTFSGYIVCSNPVSCLLCAKFCEEYTETAISVIWLISLRVLLGHFSANRSTWKLSARALSAVRQAILPNVKNCSMIWQWCIDIGQSPCFWFESFSVQMLLTSCPIICSQILCRLYHSSWF